ncbi:serine/threonine-protein kinase [Nonomuraea sp. NPDC049480]|uniref:serine/threonine-protein kinase n=1 Tax=Nonomuraea sp. NPDC049480 TaxID=3364353 RepID=UPI0037B89DAC
MPEPEGMRPGDPETVEGYRLAGRLGEGGQGIVYLAEAPDGGKVALKLLRADSMGDAEASDRFVREVALARRVATFCTARVVETGLWEGRPYIVSEYVDGPTLTEVVRADGPRSGASLHRLAIGTVTALVVIHQAGIVHRDFKPSNVLLPADGPRVIDFGIAKALDLTSTMTSAVVGTPAFMAPEQLGGARPGPATDMFAWACTMLYAASGRFPFGQDSLPAVINRIMTEQPDAGCVEDPGLRALIVDCLAKDPAARPSASAALMRLLGVPQGAVQPDAAPPDVLQQGADVAGANLTPPPMGGRPVGVRTRSRKTTGQIISVAVAAALVLASATLLLADRLNLPSGSTASSSRSPSAKSSRVPRVPTDTVTFSVDGHGLIELTESPSDPVKLFSLGSTIRKRGSQEYESDGRHIEYAVSDDGGKLLATNLAKADGSVSRTSVSVIDRVTGAGKNIALDKMPTIGFAPRWSPDGKHGLVSLYDVSPWLTLDPPDRDVVGYAVIDTEAGVARLVKGKDAPANMKRAFWVSSATIGVWTADEIRFYDLNGNDRGSLPDSTPPPAMDADPVAPGGSRYLARCTPTDTSLCVRSRSQSATGPIAVPFTVKRVVGWWDDDHLMVWRGAHSGWEIVVIDLTGKAVRVLLSMNDPKYVAFPAPNYLHFGKGTV